MWKEEIGPVAKEFSDEIWDKFSAATKIIHDKRHEYIEELEKKAEENVTLKKELILEINTLTETAKNKGHQAWQNTIKKVQELRDQFFESGKVPRSKNKEIWNLFKEATRNFNKEKNAFYKEQKKEQFNNLAKKRELIKIAEDNKDGEDFDTLTPLMKKIQSDWKEIGRSRVKAIANDFGIKSNIPLVPSMALGTAESTLLEITGAYAGILNKGISSIPYGLSSITIQGDSDSLLDHDMNTSLRVINENAANQLTFMMMQVIRSGTGIRADLGERQAAGKTGTTQGARDAWFIGFTADYVVGVWMGYDDNRKLTGVTGGGMPADIWRETMLRIHENIPLKNLIIDENKLINELETANGVEFINRIFKGLGDKAKKNSDNDFKSLLKNLFN